MILSIRNLSKKYGAIRAVDDLSLDIEQGNVYGILGPNGSGKTTTLGIILGILRPQSGTYEWFENQHKNPFPRIGALLETPNFYPYLNAIDNLEIVRHIRRAPKSDYSDILKMVNLYERRKSPFRTYSLGMKQRLAIAATLIGDPEVLIFDEPTNGLDPKGIAEVRETLIEIARGGRTVIMASHILYEVEKICTHVAILRKGKLLAKGPIGAIINDDVILEAGCADLESLQKILNDHPYIRKIDPKDGYLEIQASQDLDAAEINKLAYGKQLVLTHLRKRRTSLEEEFLTITEQK